MIHRKATTPSELRAQWAELPGVTYPAPAPPPAAPAEECPEYVFAAAAAAMLQTQTRHLASYARNVHRITINGELAYSLHGLQHTVRFAALQNAAPERPADTLTEREAAALFHISRTAFRKRAARADLPPLFWRDPAGHTHKLYKKQDVLTLTQNKK